MFFKRQSHTFHELFHWEYNVLHVCVCMCLTQFTQYLSDCGGVLGLWLGMSVLTIFEFVEFALDISVLACVEVVLDITRKHDMKRRRNRIQPQDTSKKSPPPPPPNAPGYSPEPPMPPSSARPTSPRPATADQLVSPRHPNAPLYEE